MIAVAAAVRSAAVADGATRYSISCSGCPSGTSAATSVGLIQAETSGVLTEPAMPTTTRSRPGASSVPVPNDDG